MVRHSTMPVHIMMPVVRHTTRMKMARPRSCVPLTSQPSGPHAPLSRFMPAARQRDVEGIGVRGSQRRRQHAAVLLAALRQSAYTWYAPNQPDIMEQPAMHIVDSWMPMLALSRLRAGASGERGCMKAG